MKTPTRKLATVYVLCMLFVGTAVASALPSASAATCQVDHRPSGVTLTCKGARCSASASEKGTIGCSAEGGSGRPIWIGTPETK